MSTTGNRLTDTLESHPRLTGAVFTTVVVLTFAVSAVAAGGGSGGSVGP